MVTDLDLESQILGFRVRRREKKKGKRNWKESKRRTNCSQRNLFLHRNGWYGKYCSTREHEETRPFLASFAYSNQAFAISAKLLGGLFDKEEEASRAYDPAALKLCSESTPLNFPVSDYENEVEDMKAFSKKDYMLHIRRNMTGFAKGMSKCRGVSKFSLGKNRGIDYLIILCPVDNLTFLSTNFDDHNVRSQFISRIIDAETWILMIIIAYIYIWWLALSLRTVFDQVVTCDCKRLSN